MQKDEHRRDREGEHGKRDQVNDPRSKNGRFAHDHHDAGDTVKAALDGLERQGEENLKTQLEEMKGLGDGSEKSQGGIVPAVNDKQRQDRELAEALNNPNTQYIGPGDAEQLRADQEDQNL